MKKSQDQVARIRTRMIDGHTDDGSELFIGCRKRKRCSTERWTNEIGCNLEADKVIHTGTCEFEANMAEASTKEPLREENNQNTSRITRRDVLKIGQSLPDVGDEGHTVEDVLKFTDRKDNGQNDSTKLVGQEQAHVEMEQDNKSTTSQIVGVKSQKLSPLQIPTDRKTDACISPETGGKRRRVQHDYRRLSSSGYVDDYIGRERRFSSTSESELSLSPTPPKSKPHKMMLSPVADNVANGVQSGKEYFLLWESLMWTNTGCSLTLAINRIANNVGLESINVVV